MKIEISPNKEELGRQAAGKAAEILRETLEVKPIARFIAATGVSQFEFLENLCKADGIHWQRAEMFHLDEYVGIPITHPASFRNYLSKRLVEKVHPGIIHFIEGDARDPEAECRRVGELIAKEPVDVTFIGIGENGHVAFNDPPADFESEKPYLVVNLDEKCRQQQIGEGWFKTLEEVPKQAISMSVRQIMKAKRIICICPDKRKAEAVRDCLSIDASVTPLHPASILKQHAEAYIFLDENSASLLRR